jgi:hypothetical protein
MMKGFVVVVLSLIVSGCAASPYSPAVTTADVPVICKKEKPTGSNLRVTVCRPVRGVLEREDTVRDMRVLKRQTEQ